MIRRADVMVSMAALAVGALCAFSTGRWLFAAERGAVEARDAKLELMASAGLFDLHNKVYSRIGPWAWETRVKPDFMRAITHATVRETGNMLPDWRDVVGWVRAHPAEARRLLENAEVSARE